MVGIEAYSPSQKNVVFFVAVEESQQMYQLRKVALEARRNKPDLNCHYTKIKVPQVKIAHVVLLHTCKCPYMYMCYSCGVILW